KLLGAPNAARTRRPPGLRISRASLANFDTGTVKITTSACSIPCVVSRYDCTCCSESTAASAPYSIAICCFCSDRSTTTIEAAPATFAPCTAFIPTPPAPTTTQWSPDCTFPACTAAPYPVGIAQPSSAATSNGISFGTTTQEVAGTTENSANVPRRLCAFIRASFSRKRGCWSPCWTLRIFTHKLGRPSLQKWQSPQLGRKVRTT